MATSQALEVQEKKELVSKEEKTVPARYFVPTTDIFETADALTVVMELPGVDKQALDVNIENDVLRVEGRIDHLAFEYPNDGHWNPHGHAVVAAAVREALSEWAPFRQ